VAVEKLASEKSAKIKTRQEALQGIYFDHLDIFYLPISANFEKKGVFRQPRLLPTLICMSAFKNIKKITYLPAASRIRKPVNAVASLKIAMRG
jgi:hypothetical protein